MQIEKNLLNQQNRKEESIKPIAMALMEMLPETPSPPLRVIIAMAKTNCLESRG